MKITTVLFCLITLVMFYCGCSNQNNYLKPNDTINLDCGDGKRLMILRLENSLSIVLFRDGLDELGVEILKDKIEIQRKAYINGDLFLSITDKPDIIPKIRLKLDSDGNVISAEVLEDCKFQKTKTCDAR